MKNYAYQLRLLIFCLIIPLHVFAQNESSITKKSSSPTSKKAAIKQGDQKWKLGIALYSFHSVSFPEELIKADSVGIKYVEGFTFGKAGAELKDSLIMDLSAAGIEKLNALVKKKGLKMESIYAVGGKTVNSWEKEFIIAKKLNVSYVTCEPPVDLWDSIDSLAGLYGIKVAIHNHRKGTSAYWHPDSVIAAIKNHPNFGACPDLGHWIRSGINPADGLKKLEGHIISIHLKDIAENNNPDAQDVPLGKGVIDFPAVFSELKRQNYTGYLVLEDEVKPGKLASVIESLTYYRKQINILKRPVPK